MKLLKKFVVSMIIIGMVIIFSSVEGVTATKDTASQRWDGTVGAVSYTHLTLPTIRLV